MYAKVRLTDGYNVQKNTFISVNNQHSQLVTAIKRLERRFRDINIVQPPGQGKLQFSLISESTHISYVSLAHITCLVLLNYETNELAPCYLAFEGVAALDEAGQKDRADTAKAVKCELGW